MFVSILVGIILETEFLCSTLGMFCARIVLPIPLVSFWRVDSLVLGVMMAIVVGRVYG